MTTSSRKLDHIRICLEKPEGAEKGPFEDLVLLHKALPEIDEADIDTSCQFLGKKLKAPLMISAMTGGHPDVKQINARLGEAASELGIALGVGSQRAALEDRSLEDTFSVVRDAAPDIPIIGNIGAVQLKRSGPEILERLAEMIDADAIAVHLNFLQESIQPEGDKDAGGVLEVLRLAAKGPVPIMVKETGAGISREVAQDLVSAGVKMIDVSGVGGLSWAGVESFRAAEVGDDGLEQMGRLFESWGVPTPVSIVECKAAGAFVISSGGVKSGLDAAKSLALGASLAGAALPLLRPATKDKEAVVRVMDAYICALRITMFLTGCKEVTQLARVPLVVLGRTREWLQARGFDLRAFSVYRELKK
ncbi:MAG: type 2 isopentenyl-diphosphate Delta-isomerase [Methanotrichaceae archaeon]|nr:type 2 isopentenyl-diphosphate Delta-isomerase [Methanotrichaceae archaeon]